MQHKRLLFFLFASFLLVSVPIDIYAMEKGELEQTQEQPAEQTKNNELEISPPLSAKPAWQAADKALDRAKQTPEQQKPGTEQSEQEDSLDEALADLLEVTKQTQSTTPPLSPKEKHSAQTYPREEVLNSPQSATDSSGYIIQLSEQPNALISFDPVSENEDDLAELGDSKDELPNDSLLHPQENKKEEPIAQADDTNEKDENNHTNQTPQLVIAHLFEQQLMQHKIFNAALFDKDDAPVHISVQQPEVQAAPAVAANVQLQEEQQNNPVVENNVDDQEQSKSIDSYDETEGDNDPAPQLVDNAVDQNQNNGNDSDDSESTQDSQQEESSLDESSKDITIDTDETDLHRDNPIDSRKEQEVAPDKDLLDGITDSEEEIEAPPAPPIEPKSFLQQCANGAWVAFNHPILGPLMMFAGSMGVKKILETMYRSPRLNKHQKTIDKKVVPLLAQAAFANILQKGYGAWHEHEQSHSTLVYMPCYAAIDLLGKGVLPVAQKFLHKTAVGKKLIKKGKRFYAKQTRKRKKQINVAANAYKVIQNAVLAHMLANVLVGAPAATA